MTQFNGSVSMTLVWLIAMVVLLVIEGIVPGLVSIWFAAGALVALVVSLFGAPLWLQMVWFVVVSIALLALTRPLAKKYVNSRTTPTNADRIIGADCLVSEEINNLSGTGSVLVDGKFWTARLNREDQTAEPGEVLRVERIDGVKLIVAKKEA